MWSKWIDYLEEEVERKYAAKPAPEPEPQKVEGIEIVPGLTPPPCYGIQRTQTTRSDSADASALPQVPPVVEM